MLSPNMVSNLQCGSPESGAVAWSTIYLLFANCGQNFRFNAEVDAAYHCSAEWTAFFEGLQPGSVVHTRAMTVQNLTRSTRMPLDLHADP